MAVTVPPPALAPPPGHPRFPLFDGLRAVAAVSVLVFHTAFYSRVSESGSGAGPFLARLNVGVAIFFVISGFLLYRPLLAARSGSGPAVRLRDYARRRVLRIVPAYWVALTVLAIYPGLTGVFSGQWWVFYGFGQDYGANHTIVSGIGPAWTLGCEVVFYALLPFLALGLGALASRAGRRVWWQGEFACLSALSAASFVFRAVASTDPSLSESNIAATFAWFAIGMALAYASVLWLGPDRVRAERASRYAWAGWVMAALAYVLLCRGIGLRAGNVLLVQQDTAAQLGIYALSGLVAFGLALPAIAENAPRSPAGRLLASPAIAWLGLISYGVYLYHEPVARALSGGLSLAGASWGKFAWLTLSTAAIAVIAGALSYYLVERPLLRLKDGWAIRRRVGRRSAGPLC